MSYILDALRKSEQQRQATQPDTVTDRILLNQPQPRQRPNKWIAALIISNLLVVAYFVWFFTTKAPEPQRQAASHPEQQPLDNRLLPPATSAQDSIAQKPDQLPPRQTTPEPPSPSIAQLIGAKKIAGIQRPSQQIPEKKPLAVKKEPATRKAAVTAPKPEILATVTDKPATLPKKGVLALDELPYEIRNTLPNLTINVFSYAHQPEDRFVIIDMVKYRAGQLIKGSVKLKEIRPDSIVLQYGDDTFRVERP